MGFDIERFIRYVEEAGEAAGDAGQALVAEIKRLRDENAALHDEKADWMLAASSLRIAYDRDVRSKLG